MDAVERPTFETNEARSVYQYVERHGTAARHRARAATELDTDEFREAVEHLLSKGYLADDGGTLSLALDVGSIETYENGSVTYTIRPARPDDFEGLVEAIRNVSDESTYVVAESVAEQLLYEDAVTRHNTVQSRVFFVATVDDEVVGWCHLDLPQLDKLRETAQLTVGVVSAYRGQDIGSQLIERGIEWARANGYRKLYNSVPATMEPALAFLEDHGWNTEGIRRNHYTVGDEQVDEVMMAYTFD
ncbi:GNAT family N-acetyltransferase [Halomicroarcula limicola]|uniref:GNAT family N-acetyltransferase n=1 Tax=Haloarcula limicola TaxID=1429915 RepID=A0A8J8C4G7_9EURY|nr:GNAT family N-acetyltransferase [Halomicroarcula limicola]MBV0925287.1 GNAT family N-acetyltransferase [Halomicroarcula limicola]